MARRERREHVTVAHTPGPWELHLARAGANSVRVCVPDATVARGCRPIAEAEILGVPRLEAEANARLIAQAPELLKLLIAATHGLRSYIYGNASPDLAAEIVAAADAVVNRASGAV
jgi:hypothetical protein